MFLASTKRSHDWISGTSGGGGNSGVVTGDQIHQQVSTASPVGQNIPATSPSPAAPLSPSSSNVSVRKKIVSLIFISFLLSHFLCF